MIHLTSISCYRYFYDALYTHASQTTNSYIQLHSHFWSANSLVFKSTTSLNTEHRTISNECIYKSVNLQPLNTLAYWKFCLRFRSKTVVLSTRVKVTSRRDRIGWIGQVREVERGWERLREREREREWERGWVCRIIQLRMMIDYRWDNLLSEGYVLALPTIWTARTPFRNVATARRKKRTIVVSLDIKFKTTQMQGSTKNGVGRYVPFGFFYWWWVNRVRFVVSE